MLPARPFYMIRHGETVMNALRLSCGGGVDTVLNDAGRAQAALAAKVLEALPEKPSLIINSGMSRTRETTEIINKNTGIKVLEDNELREHMLGEWENGAWDETLPKIRSGARPLGGESIDDFATRVRDALARNLRDHASESILFVAHGGIFHSFQRFQGQNRRTFIPNAALHRFDPEQSYQPMPWRVTLYGWENGLTQGPAGICPSRPEVADSGWDSRAADILDTKKPA